MPNPLSQLPDGAPPTLEQHRLWARGATRNYTDDPLGQHRHQRQAPPSAIPTADILRRTNTPVEGERTPEQAAIIREWKQIADTLGCTPSEARTELHRRTKEENAE